jgi:hypothetical protein
MRLDGNETAETEPSTSNMSNNRVLVKGKGPKIWYEGNVFTIRKNINK